MWHFQAVCEKLCLSFQSPFPLSQQSWRKSQFEMAEPETKVEWTAISVPWQLPWRSAWTSPGRFYISEK